MARFEGSNYPPGCSSVPGDEPEYDEIGRVQRRAKREHRCDVCGQPIRPGTLYTRVVFREDGGPIKTAKWHMPTGCDWSFENDPFDYERDRRRDDREIHGIGEDQR